MIQPQPEQIREAVQAFVDRMPAGWKVYEHKETFYAGRRFEYRSGARALLAAQPRRYSRNPKAWLVDDPIDLVKEWSAEVSTPFSAGPETSHYGKLAAVEEWVERQNGWLALPYALQDCKEVTQAEAMVATLPSSALCLLAVVFDIDFYQGRNRIVREIVAACAPVAAKARR